MASLTPKDRTSSSKYDPAMSSGFEPLYSIGAESAREGSILSGKERARRTAILCQTKRSSGQLAALQKWALRRKILCLLEEDHSATLVVNGSNDVLVNTELFHLQQNLLDAQLILYPDSNHGAQYQYRSCLLSTPRNS